jgi:tRNA(Ile)-lysidine synthase
MIVHMPVSQAIPASHHTLVKAVAHGLRRQCGVKEGAHILVAVSGGADSVALLRALAALKNRRRWRLKLTVGHVQHHLRGDAAEADAGFVVELARRLKLPQVRVDLDLSGETGNVEDAARRGRYGALVQMARECGATFIATGHHGDDQLETLLMRMLRGAGTGGMRGIAWERSGFGYRVSGIGEEDAPDSDRHPTPDTRYPTIIRPMLAVSRLEINDYLNAIGQVWREDETNADVSRWRARLRAEVLPVLEAIRSGAGRKATVFADHLRDVHRVMDDAVQEARGLVGPGEVNPEAVGPGVDGVGFEREAGKRLRGVVLSGLLRGLLMDAGVSADTLGGEQVGRVVRAVCDGEGGERVFMFARGVRVEVRRDRVLVCRG